MTQGSENRTLSAMLEEDREQVLSRLQADRTPEAAVRVLEQETDRLMYRTAEWDAAPVRGAGAGTDAAAYGDTGRAQQVLKVVKNSLPLVGAVNDTEVWQKSSGQQNARGRRIPLPAIALLAAGAVCVFAGLIGQSAAGALLKPMCVVWCLIGCVLLAAGGWMAGRGSRKGGEDSAGSSFGRTSRYAAGDEISQNFLIDPESVWHVYRAMMLTADHSLDEMQEQERALLTMNGTGAGQVPAKEEIEFFSELLENAYARLARDGGDAQAREQVEYIRYYLHTKGIETVDYTPQDKARFECLPSGGAERTLRPALMSGTVVIRKGLAAV